MKTDTTKLIKICPDHRDRETPLITTFRFPGAELWCPHCGALAGMFDGFGCEVPATDELKKRAVADREANIATLRGSA